MAKATVTFLKSDLMKPNKNGVAYSEECWNNFVSIVAEKFTDGEVSSVCHYSDSERIECTLEVRNAIIIDTIPASMELRK